MAKAEQAQHYNKPLEDALGFSAVINAGGTLHLAGIVSINEAGEVFAPGDASAQMDRIYDIMVETLAKNGATLEHVVSEVIYTTDMARLMEATPIRANRYKGFANPATTAVQISALAFPDVIFEIQAIAQLGPDEWSADIPPLGSPV